MKEKRIQRHNEIRDLVADRLRKNGGRVLLEHEFVSPENQVLRPDIVVKTNESTALIVDITLRFERGRNLELGAQNKVRKYTPLIPVVKRTLGVEKAAVVPIVLGTRGGLLEVDERDDSNWNEQR